MDAQYQFCVYEDPRGRRPVAALDRVGAPPISVVPTGALASSSIGVHRHDRGVPRADAAHFQADHLQVECIRILIETALLCALATYREFTEENPAEVGNIEHVSERGSGSALVDRQFERRGRKRDQFRRIRRREWPG